MSFLETFSHGSSVVDSLTALTIQRLQARDRWEALSAGQKDVAWYQSLADASSSDNTVVQTIMLESGIALYDLHTFVEQYPVLAHKYILAPEHEPVWQKRMYDAFIEAYWRTGIVVFVPPTIHNDTIVDIRALLESYSRDVMIEKCIIIVQAHAQVTILDRRSSFDSEARIVMRSVDCIVSDYAMATVHIIQQSDALEYEYVRYSLQAGCKSTLQFVAALSGSFKSTFMLDCLPHGKQASIDARVLAVLNAQKSLLCASTQRHPSAAISSNVLVKACVDKEGSFDYKGSVLIEHDAPKSSAHQRNMVLMLGENAQAHSLPILEVQQNDVSCSHGSALGQLDPQHIFYMQTRGLSRRQARKVLLRGFMEDILVLMHSINHELLSDELVMALNNDM